MRTIKRSELGEVEKEKDFGEPEGNKRTDEAQDEIIEKKNKELAKEEEKKPEEPKEEMVSISRASIESFQKTLEELKTDRDTLKEIVMQTADKRRLARYMSQISKDLPKEVDLGMIGGKVVVAWTDMVVNEVEKNPRTGVWQEKQTTKVIYEDGTNEEMEYRDFVMKLRPVHCKRTNVIQDETTKVRTFTVVRLDTGQEYKIVETFINPVK